jgi:ribonuclease HII
MVVAGVSATREGVARLKGLGVKDSKALSAKRRGELFPEILKAAEKVCWECVPPGEIDEVVFYGRRLRKLNYLEAVYFAKVIDVLGAQRVTVDASDVVPGRFGRDITRNLAAKCRIVSRHKADRDFPIVSAASIVAKVERDRQVEMLRDAHGDFGSGYPSDPATKSFFLDWMKRGDPLPPYVRKSWKTFVNIEQTLLATF